METVYILRSDELKKAAKQYIDDLPLDPLYQMVIQEYERDRTAAQNRLMWHWLREISNQHDDTRGSRFGPESWKEYYQQQFLGKHVIDLPMGGHSIATVGTSSLGVKKFTEFLDRLSHAAVELGYQLTHTADYAMAMTGHLEE